MILKLLTFCIFKLLWMVKQPKSMLYYSKEVKVYSSDFFIPICSGSYIRITIFTKVNRNGAYLPLIVRPEVMIEFDAARSLSCENHVTCDSWRCSSLRLFSSFLSIFLQIKGSGDVRQWSSIML